MSKGNSSQSALFIGTGDGDDDATLLVVGGCGGNENEAELLTNRPPQRRGEQGSEAVHGGGDSYLQCKRKDYGAPAFSC